MPRIDDDHTVGVNLGGTWADIGDIADAAGIGRDEAEARIAEMDLDWISDVLSDALEAELVAALSDRGIAIPYQLDDGAFPPTRAHAADAGLDLRSLGYVTVPAHGSAIVHTGTHVQIKPGFYGKLESKSGLNVNHGVFCTGGVIDAGFTGAIRFRLANCSDEDYVIAPGDKAVQMVVVPCECGIPVEVGAVGATGTRGDAGWGSTGR